MDVAKKTLFVMVVSDRHKRCSLPMTLGERMKQLIDFRLRQILREWGRMSGVPKEHCDTFVEKCMQVIAANATSRATQKGA